MNARNVAVLAGAALIAGIVLQNAWAAASAAPLARNMVLAPADFVGGATVVSGDNTAGTLRGQVPYESAYTREFNQARIHSTPLLYLSDSAVVTPAASLAHIYTRKAAAYLATKAGRAAYLTTIRLALAKDVGTSASLPVSFVRQRRLKIGGAATELEGRISLGAEHAYFGVLLVQEGAVVESLWITSIAPITLGDSAALADLVTSRIDIQLAPPPRSISLPIISGALQPGTLMSAKPGRWIGRSVTYSYQWLRCDSRGEACAPISGADSSTFTVRASDQGFTLAVAVQATNPTGTATAQSHASAIVG